MTTSLRIIVTTNNTDLNQEAFIFRGIQIPFRKLTENKEYRFTFTKVRPTDQGPERGTPR